MPCVAHECHPRLPAANHCKSLSWLVRETYARCHAPCLGTPAAGWSSGDDENGALDTKQVVLNEMRKRQLKESRCKGGLADSVGRLRLVLHSAAPDKLNREGLDY